MRIRSVTRIDMQSSSKNAHIRPPNTKVRQVASLTMTPPMERSQEAQMPLARKSTRLPRGQRNVYPRRRADQLVERLCLTACVQVWLL